MTLFLLLNIKEDILKNPGKQTVLVTVDFHLYWQNILRHFSKYLLLRSTEVKSTVIQVWNKTRLS